MSILLAIFLLAAPPMNDGCASAESIPPSGPFPHVTTAHDVIDATSVGDPVPTCQSNVSRGIWFSFTPSATTEYSFSTCPSAPTATTLDDTVLAVYRSTDGSCGGELDAVLGGCDDDGCDSTSLQSSIADLPLEAGTTYYVLAYAYSTVPPASGRSSVQLRVTQAPPVAPPPNDTCAGAVPIPSSGPFPHLTPTITDVSGATTAGDPPAPPCQPNGTRSVWYRFVPSLSSGYEISSCAAAPTATTVDDTALSVYASSDGTCSGALTQIAGGCDDNTCGSEPNQAVIPSVALQSGTTYFIVAEKVGPTRPSAGNTALQLRITPTDPPPANDACASAIVVPAAGPFPFLAPSTPDVRYATAAGDPPAPPSCQAAVSRSVWYVFAPAESAAYDLALCADAGCTTTADDTVLSVYPSPDGTCGSLRPQARGGCDDDGCAIEPNQSVVRGITLLEGTTYYLAVQQYGASPPPGSDASVQLRVARVGAASPDADSDGTANAGDCAPNDAAAWASPGPARGLRFENRIDLTWSEPADPGAPFAIYDVVRSTNPGDFSAATTVAEDLDSTTASDAAIPSKLFAYLVRTRNACP